MPVLFWIFAGVLLLASGGFVVFLCLKAPSHMGELKMMEFELESHRLRRR